MRQRKRLTLSPRTPFHFSEASDLADGAVKVVALDAGDGGPGPVEGDMVKKERGERARGADWADPGLRTSRRPCLGGLTTRSRSARHLPVAPIREHA